MFRRMREAAEREARRDWEYLVTHVTLFMRQEGFTDRTEGNDLVFHRPHSATAVMLGALRNDFLFGGVVERWEREGATITQTDGHSVQAVLHALNSFGSDGRWLAEFISRQPFVVFTENGDGQRMRVAMDGPITLDNADRVFEWVQAQRARELAVKRERLMWEVE